MKQNKACVNFQFYSCTSAGVYHHSFFQMYNANRKSCWLFISITVEIEEQENIDAIIFSFFFLSLVFSFQLTFRIKEKMLLLMIIIIIVMMMTMITIIMGGVTSRSRRIKHSIFCLFFNFFSARYELCRHCRHRFFFRKVEDECSNRTSTRARNSIYFVFSLIDPFCQWYWRAIIF